MKKIKSHNKIQENLEIFQQSLACSAIEGLHMSNEEQGFFKDMIKKKLSENQILFEIKKRLKQAESIKIEIKDL